MAVFAVTTARGPAWDAARDIRDQDGWDEHAAFADSLVEQGVTLFGGPIGTDADAGSVDDGSSVDAGSVDDVALVVLELPDAREVHRTFEADPWLVSGVLRLRSVRPWTLWLDGRSR